MGSSPSARKPCAFCRLIIGLGLAGAMASSNAATTARLPTATKAHPTSGAVFASNFKDDEALDVVVGLKLRNSDKLDAVVNALVTPGDPNYQQWLSKEALALDYLPTKLQVQAVVDFLTKSGFTSIEAAENNLLVTAKGTALAIRTAFNTQMAHYESKDSGDVFANLSDVTVPSDLSEIILSVEGLQTIDVGHPATVQTLNPTFFPTTYAATSLSAASSTAVGIVSDGNLTAVLQDLHTFQVNHSLPIITPVVVTVGATSSDTVWVIEWDLDSQVIQATAGGSVSQLRFYNGPSLSNAALTADYNKAVSENIVKVLNVSIGECESGNHSDGSMAQDDLIFKTAVAQGQTISVATGDNGAYQCGGSTPTVSYPASSPYVVAVGGTTLSTAASGGYLSETAWGSGGGGSSSFEAQPAWQSGFVPGTTRALPDVAFDADPSSGAQIILNGSQQAVGGTSLSSPLFVGLFARIETTRSNSLSSPAASFYSSGISGSPNAFHDVTSGSNGGYSAAAGWDRATGWGSFNATNMNWVLASYPSTISGNFTDDCPSVRVNWTAVSGASSYRLFEEQGTLPWVGTGTLVYNGSATQTLVSIPANINYLFKVQACNATVCSVVTPVTASGKRPPMCP